MSSAWLPLKIISFVAILFSFLYLEIKRKNQCIIHSFRTDSDGFTLQIVEEEVFVGKPLKVLSNNYMIVLKFAMELAPSPMNFQNLVYFRDSFSQEDWRKLQVYHRVSKAGLKERKQ